MPNTVVLKNYLNVFIEANAAADLAPGKFVKLNSSGNAALTAANDLVPPMVVKEDDLQGKTIDDTISSGQPVQIWIPQRGDEGYVQAIGGVGGTTFNVGDLVAYGANGNLVARTSETVVVGVVIEGATLAEGATGFIKVRFA